MSILRDKNTGQFKATHGHTTNAVLRSTPTYRSWNAMRMRCINPKRKYYAQQGISVCREWESFEQFLADMGERPVGMTLERIKRKKGYYKANCRWATLHEQQQNTRANRNLRHKGQVLCVHEWARKLGFLPHQLFRRLERGWSIFRTLETPIRRYSFLS